MKPLIAILILLVASVAMAQPLVLSQSPGDGVYVLTIKNGQATLEKAIVLRVDVPTPPSPVDPVVPIPDRVKQIRDAAQGAVADPQRATTAANLSAVMDLIAGQVTAGSLKDYPTISAAVDWMWDQVTKGREAAWRPTKAIIGNHLAAMAQEGASPEEYAGYFAEAGEALGALQEGEQVEPDGAIDIEMLMKLFEFFIKYILPLIIG
jgi:hypothetical protein